MNVQARGDWIVMEPMEAPQKIGGILLPEAKREGIMQRPVGVVVSVGPDVNEVGKADPIEEGHVLIFSMHAAKAVHGLDGNVLYMTRAESVIGRVLNDLQASPDEVAALRARHDKIMSELREAQTKAEGPSRLVLANGQV